MREKWKRLQSLSKGGESEMDEKTKIKLLQALSDMFESYPDREFIGDRDSELAERVEWDIQTTQDRLHILGDDGYVRIQHGFVSLTPRGQETIREAG